MSIGTSRHWPCLKSEEGPDGTTLPLPFFVPVSPVLMSLSLPGCQLLLLSALVSLAPFGCCWLTLTPSAICFPLPHHHAIGNRRPLLILITDSLQFRSKYVQEVEASEGAHTMKRSGGPVSQIPTIITGEERERNANMTKSLGGGGDAVLPRVCSRHQQRSISS